jgi:hypothetical protein
MELIDTANDVLRQWASISEEWCELDLEHALIQTWPLDRRYLLDHLLGDIRLMSELCDELRYEVFLSEETFDRLTP